MRHLDLHCYDDSTVENPPLLHRKDAFVTADHPLREKFARLTRQEERHGLLKNASTIGTRAGWEARVECGFRLAGHRLLREKTRTQRPGHFEPLQLRSPMCKHARPDITLHPRDLPDLDVALSGCDYLASQRWLNACIKRFEQMSDEARQIVMKKIAKDVNSLQLSR